MTETPDSWPDNEAYKEATEQLSRSLILLGTTWNTLIEQTDFDYQITRSYKDEYGIRGQYAVAKPILSIDFLQGLIGEPVFLNSLHDEGFMMEEHREFGYYNPDFLIRLQALLDNVFDRDDVREATQGVYDVYFRPIMRSYLFSCLEQCLLEFYNIGWSDDFYDNGSDYYEALGLEWGYTRNGYAFWERRHQDKTLFLFKNLLFLLMKTYDNDYFEQSASESDFE